MVYMLLITGQIR